MEDYQFANKKERPSNKVPPLKDPDNGFNIYYEALEKSEILNKYFCSISKVNDAHVHLPSFESRCAYILSQILVTEQDVLDLISILDPNKAVGPDAISNRMLIEVKNEVYSPLCLWGKRFFLQDGNWLTSFLSLRVGTIHCLQITDPSHYYLV